MQLYQLQLFQAVAKAENLTRAAGEMNMSQPALSQAIRRLEEELGVRLFDRGGGRIVLNNFGRAFLAHVDVALAEVESGVEAVRRLAGEEEGVVHVIDAGHSMIRSMAVQAFREIHPMVHLVHYVQMTRSAVQSLLDGTVDFALLSTRPAHPDINWRPLGEVAFFLNIGPGHPLAGRDRVRVADLEALSFVGFPQGFENRDLFLALCRTGGFVPRYALEGVDYAMMARLGRESCLAAVYTNILSGQPVSPPEDGRVRLPIESPHNRFTIGIATGANHVMSRAAVSFADYIEDHFRRG